jgi:DNA-binding response OmpR family regulator
MIDDEQSMLRALTRALRSHGIAIEGYSAVDEFHAAANRKPDIVALVDWGLRTCEGTEVVGCMRQRGDRRRIALVSGLLDVEHGKDLARRAGADCFIEKVKPAASWADEICGLAKLPLRAPSGTFRLDPRTNATAIELHDGCVILHNHRIDLRAKEYRVLELLLERVGDQISFDELLARAFDVPAVPRSPQKERLLRGRVISTINRLRRALGSADKIIETDDCGYRIDLAPP